jgi:membrane protein DedA with SNARE-associated domain
MHPTVMQTLLLNVIAAHQGWVYAIIFLLLFLEGDALLFGIAFLAHQGFLDFLVLVPLVFFGAVASDLAWYAIGRRLDRTWPWLHRWVGRVAHHFDRHLMERPERTLLLAKFTYGGICRALIVRSGALRMPLERFTAASIQAVIIWMAVIGGLGYATSAGLSQAGHYLRFAEVALVVGMAIFILAERAAARRIKERL